MNATHTVTHTNIQLIPAPVLSQLAELDGRSQRLYLDFCYWHEPASPMVQLPFHLAWQYRAGLLEGAIADLERHHLIARGVAS